jgi:hypothetical protein
MLKLTINNKKKLISEIKGNNQKLEQVVSRMDKGYLEDYLVDIFGDKNRFAVRSEVSLGLTHPVWKNILSSFEIDKKGISRWWYYNEYTKNTETKSKKLGKHLTDLVRVSKPLLAIREKRDEDFFKLSDLRFNLRKVAQDLRDEAINTLRYPGSRATLERDAGVPFNARAEGAIIQFFEINREELYEVFAFFDKIAFGAFKDNYEVYAETKAQEEKALTLIGFVIEEFDYIIDNPQLYNASIMKQKLGALEKEIVKRREWLARNEKHEEEEISAIKKFKNFGGENRLLKKYQTMLDWWNKNSEEALRDLNGESTKDPGFVYIFSKHPIDVLRMGDHDGITSCHSPSQGYFKCAVADAKGGGAVVYLINSDQYDVLNRVNSNWERSKEEIFFDKDRPDNQNMEDEISKGKLVPSARFRIRRIVHYENGRPARDFGVPELRIYSNKFTEIGETVRAKFLKEITIILRDLQKEVFQAGLPDEEDLKLAGGDYQDTPPSKLFKNFFGLEYVSSYVLDNHPLENKANSTKHLFAHFKKIYAINEESEAHSNHTTYNFYSSFAEHPEDRVYPNETGMPWRVQYFEGGNNGDSLQFDIEDPFPGLGTKVGFLMPLNKHQSNRFIMSSYVDQEFRGFVIEQFVKSISSKPSYLRARCYNLEENNIFAIDFDGDKQVFSFRGIEFSFSDSKEDILSKLIEHRDSEIKAYDKVSQKSKRILAKKNINPTSIVNKNFASIIATFESTDEYYLKSFFTSLVQNYRNFKKQEAILRDVIFAIQKLNPDFRFEYKYLE